MRCKFEVFLVNLNINRKVKIETNDLMPFDNKVWLGTYISN